uniref:Uncharacterized protein n=1 Tax=Candidatus Kentrum sp. LFY TaxID=2126342 RepID=A0A450X143_9GAMM|nr:MAG: hypothetical protein BECKLFY1418C_GA0070996_11316 [Candidatus Kentron sp. LFY]
MTDRFIDLLISDGGDIGVFTDLHQESILGVVRGFGRFIFKGHFNSMFLKGAFEYYFAQAWHKALVKVFRAKMLDVITYDVLSCGA